MLNRLDLKFLMTNSTILIGIAGGTDSGKTSISKELLKEYGQGEVVVILQDSYYRNLSNLSFEIIKKITVAPHHVIVLEGILALHYD